MTRLHFQFAPAFLNLPIAMLEQLREQDFDLCSGLYCGTSRFYEWLVRQPVCQSRRIDHLDPLELGWVEQPLDRSSLERIREVYSDNALHRAIIADRHIGQGYVAGARIPRSRLSNHVYKHGPDAAIRYLVQLIKHLENIFDENQPDIVLLYGIAGAPAFVQQMIATNRGICSIQMESTRFEERRLLLNGADARVTMRSLMQRPLEEQSVAKARSMLSRVNNHAVVKHVNFSKSLLSDTKQIVRGIAKAASGIINKAHDTPRKSRWHEGCHDAMVPLHRRCEWVRLKRYSQGNEQLLDQPFAFYPLHVNPEASTMVAAPYHTDQVAVIEEIAKAMPPGMPLLVKEHLPMVGRRSRGFYKRLASIPGVSLLPATLKSNAVIQRAAIVIVISGSAGWEAIVAKRPVLTLGSAVWQAIESGFVEACPGEMDRCIAQAIQKTPADEDSMIKYIAAAIDNSAAVPQRLLWSKQSRSRTIDKEDCVPQLCNLVIKAFANHVNQS